MEALTVSDINSVDPIPIALDNDKTSTGLRLLEEDLEEETSPLRLLQGSSGKVIFSTDETVTYVPDAEENTEGFDTSVEETVEGIVDDDDDTKSKKGGAKKRLVKLALGVLVVAGVVCLLCGLRVLFCR